MSNKILLYKTKWGSTKEYAQIIKEAVLDVDLADIDEFDLKDLANYHTIVIGSRTYMGKIQAVDFLVKHWDVLKDKKTFLFSVGMIPMESKESKKSYEAIPPEIRNALAGYIKLPGRVDVTKLNFFDKMIFKARKVSSPDKMNSVLVEPIIRFLKNG